MNVIQMRVADIIPYDKNAKKHPADQVEHIANSIREFGWQQPLVVDKDNVLVISHGRLMAAKKLGLDQVPVVRADELNKEQIAALRLADNKTNESEWDTGLLEIELDSIIDLDMSLFGFDKDEPEVIEDDYNPVLPKEPVSKVGQIYSLGRHRLMCGDSTKKEDVERLMNGVKADLLLTDPPYNVNLGNGGSNDDARIRHKRLDGKYIENDSMANDDFRNFLFCAFGNAKHFLKDGAAFHIWHSESESYNFRGACKDVGLTVRQMLVWVKSSHAFGRQDFQRQYEVVLAGDTYDDEEVNECGYEPCLYGWKDGAGHKWYKKRREKDVLFFDKPVASKEHPTMKPILLFDYEMKCNTKNGDVVLDLFGGSGTTIMAAEQNERTAYVMEYDPKYVDVIIERWENFTGEKAELIG